ncbi:hypothetical protein Poli38472_010030 [Pythium oligandrum]|uniref:Rho-GAP domain-containing protein n=1 Tax=Pythium oligandrum TaxID=41045 RepID=A0A8K1FDK7_PYTOL|nr:hypothetical protein Poli38472_010030 [Pythium oligandrum]|eukprot:TMW58471.1 hypothetical protein Poli38472_010030 [Pythium oligandrum]
MSSCLNMRPVSDKLSPASPSSSCDDPLEISAPFGLRHDVHIRYNYAEARFEGIPDNFLEYLATLGAGNASPVVPGGSKPHAKRSRAWSSSKESQPKQPASEPLLVNQQFRLHFRQVPRVLVHGYDDRIPAVLVMLQQHFLLKKGYLVPHIFRESPNKEDRDQAMNEINHGTFQGETKDVRVIADLIKLWFRELPVPILHQIPWDQMEKLSKIDNAMEEIEASMGSLELCVLHWLADLLAHVAEHQSVNHMGIDQLAVVIAPNLIRIETENPMVAVTTSKAAVIALRSVLKARAERRQQLLAEASPPA